MPTPASTTPRKASKRSTKPNGKSAAAGDQYVPLQPHSPDALRRLPIPKGLSKSRCLALWRNMLMSRRIDDQEVKLKRQNKIFFQISGAGHEGILTALGQSMEKGRDWAIGYYRDRALMLALGYDAEMNMKSALGTPDEPSGGGRQMPVHFGCRNLKIINRGSCTGTQYLHAVGAAEAGRYLEQLRGEGVTNLPESHPEEVVVCTTGDGATSEGEWWEAMNTATNLKLPVIFLVEDNGYAISVPREVGTSGDSISRLFGNFPNLLNLEVDGCDPVASLDAAKKALAWCRAGNGPVLLHAHVTRLYSHSMSDDESAYRAKSELDFSLGRCPIDTFRERLIAAKMVKSDEFERIEAEVVEEIKRAQKAAEASPPQDPESIFDQIYSPDNDGCGDEYECAAQPTGSPKGMADLINATLHEEMARDPLMVVFGEDVADMSRAENIDQLKGKGGVFKVTSGLQRSFGKHRCFNSPLAEANIIGRAVGMATRGLRPVVEIQFFDYIWPAFQQLRNEMALMRWRSNGDYSAPIVVRVPYGGYLKGGAIYHSQTGESLFAHTPGLRVIMPSNAEDACGLLRTAIRCDDPVMFLEPKHLYRQTYNKAAHPGAEFTIPFGRANTVRRGTQCTVVTYGNLVRRVQEASRRLEAEGVDLEIIDLRGVAPYDREAIRSSVEHTHRLAVIYEDGQSFGSGAEIAAWAGEHLFDWLDAPVKRLGSADVFVGYHPDLEDRTLPQVEDVMELINNLLAY
jgi:2-oxoisovalerate dehydrogenase E1 component